MIENLTISDPLRSLNNSAFKFYLTGSRFFGNNRPTSDYDFFTQNNEDTEEYLIAEGFTSMQVVDTRYRGIEGIVKIYRKGNVDVHFVDNAVLKNKIQHVLKDLDLFISANRRVRKVMWTLALRIGLALLDK